MKIVFQLSKFSWGIFVFIVWITWIAFIQLSLSIVERNTFDPKMEQVTSDLNALMLSIPRGEYIRWNGNISQFRLITPWEANILKSNYQKLYFTNFCFSQQNINPEQELINKKCWEEWLSETTIRPEIVQSLNMFNEIKSNYNQLGHTHENSIYVIVRNFLRNNFEHDVRDYIEYVLFGIWLIFFTESMLYIINKKSKKEI